MHELKRIGIIGGGLLGHAVGDRLSATKTSVAYWDLEPSLSTVDSIETLVQSSDAILLCVPSRTTRQLAKTIAAACSANHRPVVISLSKGVEAGFVTMDQVLAQELGTDFVTGVLVGPMLATEITEGLLAGAIVSTTKREVSNALAATFSQAKFITETHDDPTGIARCAALKNVFALALGLADGLELGFNHKSVLNIYALDEFQAVLNQLGSDPALAYGMAGLGDLLATGWSGKSFNWRIGYNWAHGDAQRKGEGMHALTELASTIPLAQHRLLSALASIILENNNPHLLSGIYLEIN